MSCFDVPMLMKRTLLACCVLVCTLTGAGVSASDARVILLGGQSNMNGLGLSSGLTGDLALPLPAVQFWDSSGGGFVDLAPGFGFNSTQFGPEIQFGHALADALPGEDIVLIKYAASGTDLENNWDPATGPEYTAFKNTVAAALAELDTQGVTYNIQAMLWTQGERDARQGFGPNYESNLSAFIADVRSEYGSDLPFLVSQLSSGQTDLPALGLSQVRTAQANVAAGDPGTHLIVTDTFPLDHDGDLHFGTNGQLALGQAVADPYLAVVPEPGSLARVGLSGWGVFRRWRA